MATGKPKKPPPLPESADRKIRGFQARAAPIIAQHGGITPESEVKLRGLAHELELSDEQFHEAIADSRDPAAAHAGLTTEQKEQVRRFGKNIVRSLTKQQRDLLTPQVEQKLVEAGCTRYRLPEDLARGIVRQVAAEGGIRAVSKADARQYIANLVRQKAGESAWIDSALRERACAEGKHWGLTRDEVMELISRHASTVRRRGWLDRLVVVAAMFAIFAVGGLLAWLLIFRGALPSDERPEDPTSPAVSQPENPEPGSGEPAPGPRLRNDWWDVDLAIAMGRARKVLPGFLPVLEATQSTDPERRGAAYQDLVKRLIDGLDEEEGRTVLREIVAGCYALDPSDRSALRLREALLAVLPQNGSQLPEEDAAYRRSFWAVGAAVAALKHPGAGAARADALALALGQAVGAVVDRTLGAPEIARRCVTSLIRRFYRMLTALAAAEPTLVRQRHTALSVLALQFVDDEARLRLDVDFLGAVLPGPGDRWRDYISLIRECIDSPDPLNVLKMVEVYETSDNPKLQDYLRSRLLPRANLEIDAKVPANEVAERVREALGASLNPDDMTPADRWRLLAVRTRRAITEATATARQPEELLDESARLAGLSTMACALVQNELGYPTFDQLSRALPRRAAAQPPSGPPRSAPGRPARPAVSSGTVNQADNSARSLRHYRRIPSRTRVALVESLARFVGRIPDMKPESAAYVAEYLLSAKPENEHRQVLTYLPRLGRWPSIRLALADQMPKAHVSKERAVESVAAVLDRSVQLGPAEDWKGSLRWLLLKDVLDSLPRSGASGSQLGRHCEDASDAILEYLGTQAQLLGSAPEEYKAALSPAARMRLLVDRLAAQLASGNVRPQDQQYLAELPYELTAAEYLGASDLARTVLLDRVWLRLLAADVARHSPARADDADRIVDDLAQRDRHATDLLVQLRDGQQAILRAWMLFHNVD